MPNRPTARRSAVHIDDVDPQSATTDTAHDGAQRASRAAAPADDLTEVVGMHPDLEGPPAPAVVEVHPDIVRVIDNTAHEMLEGRLQHLLPRGRGRVRRRTWGASRIATAPSESTGTMNRKQACP